jgi:glycosyltransferase involved in cell wall biosynthesis
MGDTLVHVTGNQTRGDRALCIAPVHRGEPGWRWLADVDPFNRIHIESFFVDSVWQPMPKLTRVYQHVQYVRAARLMRRHNLVFTFCPEICLGLDAVGALDVPARKVYVGFTQDSPWPKHRIDRLSCALEKYDVITMFSQDERDVYLQRYRLNPDRVRVIPIHTDEPDGYDGYALQSPLDHPFVVSIGSPNRRFRPVAEACRKLGLPLVIITRPSHDLDNLDEMRALGATVITNAQKPEALAYLRHARMCVMAFADPAIPGGFTTLMHGMFMRTPFILTDCLGMREHVIDGQTGFVTPHADQPALEAALNRLWHERSLADVFAEAAFRYAESRHSLAAAARSFFELSESLLRRRIAA